MKDSRPSGGGGKREAGRLEGGCGWVLGEEEWMGGRVGGWVGGGRCLGQLSLTHYLTHMGSINPADHRKHLFSVSFFFFLCFCCDAGNS